MSAPPFNLAAYLGRIGMAPPMPEALLAKNRLTLLRFVMRAHSTAIPFENLDLVLRRPMSIDPTAVVQKIVGAGRGGYCLETNALLGMALSALGYTVVQMLARVKWNQPAGVRQPHTHLVLLVSWGQGGERQVARNFIADVGFASTNSVEPILFGWQAQELSDGVFRLFPVTDVSASLRCSPCKAARLLLQRQNDGQWRDMYEFDNCPAAWMDLLQVHWWCSSYPEARFMTQLFCARLVGDTRVHLLNDTYVECHADGSATKRTIASKRELVELLTRRFGLTLPSDTHGIDRFLNAEEGAPPLRVAPEPPSSAGACPSQLASDAPRARSEARPVPSPRRVLSSKVPGGSRPQPPASAYLQLARQRGETNALQSVDFDEGEGSATGAEESDEADEATEEFDLPPPQGQPKRRAPSSQERDAACSDTPSSSSAAPRPQPEARDALELPAAKLPFNRVLVRVHGYYQWWMPYGVRSAPAISVAPPRVASGAAEGKCGFPGCGLPEKHSGPHEVVAIEGKRKREPSHVARILSGVSG